MTTVAITGNTYPVKDQIKALGGRWNPDQKAWMVPADKADAARRLVAGAGTTKSKSSRSSRYNSIEQTYRRRYGWDGVRGSRSYYTSGMYDEES